MKIIYSDGRVDNCPEGEELHVIRHTAAHVMAQAIKRLYPHADFAYGPATEKGFYYDVDLGDTKLTDDDLGNIEQEMKKIVKENLPIKPYILPRDEAIAHMEERGEKYKVEHIGDLDENEPISFYKQGEYMDMCVGPHLCYTKALKAFKITRSVGRLLEKRQKQQNAHTHKRHCLPHAEGTGRATSNCWKRRKSAITAKSARKWDCLCCARKAPDSRSFCPRVWRLKTPSLTTGVTFTTSEDYVEVSTPMIMNRHLWETSGHWDHYKDNMYSTIIDDDSLLHKADELPRRRNGIRVKAAQLP